jgi:hypothetical protein
MVDHQNLDLGVGGSNPSAPEKTLKIRRESFIDKISADSPNKPIWL